MTYLNSFRRKTSLHKKLLLAPIVFAWCFALFDMAIIKMIYEPHIIGRSIVSFNSSTGLCGLAAWKSDTVREYVRTTVAMILPFFFNLVTYAIVIFKIRSRTVKISHKIASLKSFMICFFFTLSWIPSFIALDLMRSKDEITVRASQLCLYLNCLLDPLLYSLPTKTVIRLLNKLGLGCDRQVSGEDFQNRPKRKKVSGPKTTEKTNVMFSG